MPFNNDVEQWIDIDEGELASLLSGVFSDNDYEDEEEFEENTGEEEEDGWEECREVI